MSFPFSLLSAGTLELTAVVTPLRVRPPVGFRCHIGHLAEAPLDPPEKNSVHVSTSLGFCGWCRSPPWLKKYGCCLPLACCLALPPTPPARKLAARCGSRGTSNVDGGAVSIGRGGRRPVHGGVCVGGGGDGWRGPEGVWGGIRHCKSRLSTRPQGVSRGKRRGGGGRHKGQNTLPWLSSPNTPLNHRGGGVATLSHVGRRH